jgi:hypothetical protein
MAEQPGTVKLAPAKKKAPAYELVTDESGVMRKVAVKPGAAAAAAPATAPRPPVPVVVAEEEELVFGNEGELTGEAREAAIQAARRPITISDEEELVFDNEGEVVEAPPKEAPKAAGPPPRKTKKTVTDFSKADEFEKVKAFYRLRAKNSRFYGYTAEGNLEIKPENPAGFPATVLTMRAFSALKPEELEEIESKQRELQASVETEYVAKMKELREAYDAFSGDRKSTEFANQIVRLNEELRGISVRRNKILYPERWIDSVDNPEIRSILLNMTHEQRKLGYDAFLFKRYALSRQDAEGHYRAHGEAGGAAVGGGTTVLFITAADDPKTGHFHPIYETEFVYNETKYASPYQAFETERFKELEDEQMVKKLLGTRSARTIQQLVSQDPRPPKNSEVLWTDILEELYAQNKSMADKLKQTGSARFHMMDKQFGNPLYANALVTVRTKLKERDDDAPSGGDIVKQSVITEEEQQKAKVGAIINNFRRRG